MSYNFNILNKKTMWTNGLTFELDIVINVFHLLFPFNPHYSPMMFDINPILFKKTETQGESNSTQGLTSS